jgi:heme A synthase
LSVVDPSSVLLVIHNGLFRTGLLITAFIGVWGLVTYFRKQPSSGSFRATLVLTEVLFIVQGVVGVLTFANGRRPHDNLHWLYGVLLVIVLPIAMSYVSGRDPRREPLVYGIAGLFMFGLALRASMTGHI